MRREPPPRANPVRALIAGVALLVAFQWYGPGGYAHIRFQHQKQPPAETGPGPEENAVPPAPAYGPYEMYGPFQKSAGQKSAG